MSNPKHTLFWMTLFLGVVVIVGALIHKPLISAFMANWVFNLLILGVLIVGIALTYRQVFVLFPELKWIAQFRTGHAGLSVVQELRRALRDDEFVLHYQPKVALDSGAVVGAEALIRWLTPSGELRPPGAFMDVAEDTGLIRDRDADAGQVPRPGHAPEQNRREDAWVDVASTEHEPHTLAGEAPVRLT